MSSEDLGVRVKDEPTASRGSGHSLGRMAGDPSLGFILQLNSWSQGRQGPSPVPQELCLPSSLVQERGGLHRKMSGAGLLLPPCGALDFRAVGGRRGRNDLDAPTRVEATRAIASASRLCPLGYEATAPGQDAFIPVPEQRVTADLPPTGQQGRKESFRHKARCVLGASRCAQRACPLPCRGSCLLDGTALW